MNTKHNTINRNDQGDPSGFYDALIEEHEEQAVLDCGCILDRSVAFETNAVALTYCPMHDAAAELLAACRKALFILPAAPSDADYADHIGGEYGRIAYLLAAAIAKASP
jgi:hypothetical protein